MSKNLRINNKQFVDETRKLSFIFNGKKLYGYKGDTLASALLSNDIHLVGRSFKYHRPRGIMTSGSEEPNAILQIGNDDALTDPNVRATEIELYDGLICNSQNCWPSVKFDIGGINNFLSPLLPAGFYYKTFMWPASFWEKYEYFIRKSAGLGKSPTKQDPDMYDHRYMHCDILIVGGGVSGLIAAKIAILAAIKPETPPPTIKMSQCIYLWSYISGSCFVGDFPKPADLRIKYSYFSQKLAGHINVL